METTTTRPLNVLLDTRMALRGLGIATFVDRLTVGFAAHPEVSLSRWQGSGEWGARGQLSTLARSGPFDISPRLDPRSRNFDALHYVSNVGSIFPGGHSVLTVHDMLYRRNLRPRDRLYGFLLEQSLPRAGRVVSVSSQTASNIERAFPSLAGRVTVIPHGMRRRELPRSDRIHVLAFGGGADPRKRTDLMVAVYREYREIVGDPLPLVVLARAGLTDDQARQLRELGADIIDVATAEQTEHLMATAAALLYPTSSEGFGLPVLEAAEVGTPVVLDAAADIATEVRGRHCVPVGDQGPRAWATALQHAIASGPVPDALDLPDWSAVSGLYLELYREVAG